MKYSWFIILLVLFLLLHIPFLNADPDVVLDRYSRGPWTDEGLYTSQVRNWVNHGNFKMWESDAFIKTPLFGTMHIPFFKIFGTGLLISRLMVLFTTFLSLLLFARAKEFRIPALFILLIAFSQYHIFQYSHLGLSEMMSVSAICLSALFLFEFYTSSKNWQLFISCSLILIAILLKVQYIYTIVIIPLTTFLLSLKDVLKSKERNWRMFKPFIFSVGILILFSFMLFLVYYLPNKAIIQHVFGEQTNSRYPTTLANIRDTVNFNFNTRFLRDGLCVIDILLPISMIIAVFLLFVKRDIKLKVPILFGFIWLFVELNKVIITNVPTRYCLSLFFASIFFISFVITEMSSYKKYLFKAVLFIILLVCIYQLSFSYKAYHRRTYVVQKINNYLNTCNIGEQVIIGGWAPTLAGNTKALTLPVWNHYFGSHDPIHTYKPRMVISEFDETDSDHAYSSQGIDLKSIADSSKAVKINKYILKLYWINKDSL